MADFSKKHKIKFIPATREEALGFVQGATVIFYVLGALTLIAALALSNFIILADAFLFIAPTFLLHKFKSRVAAVLLLLISLINLIGKFISLDLSQGIMNLKFILIVVFSGIFLMASIRAVAATFKLNTVFREP